jgi:arginine/lysine/ornithine decarboxylase
LKGVMVVSPTYHGICSDLRGIAAICHDHGASLLVDEAHGAHFYFSDSLPDGAMHQGADMCAQSIHKVTGSLTQSSMLHVRKGHVDLGRVETALKIVQSTSPSYLLMTSLDLARYELANRGNEMISHAVSLSERARARINALSGMRCLDQSLVGHAGVSAVDTTRLIISAAELGITGFDLARELYERFNIDLELSDYMNVLAIITYANIETEMDRLTESLSVIAEEGTRGTAIVNDVFLPGLPPREMTPRDAWFAAEREVPWKASKGCIAAEMLAPYPPGIPVVYPGEIITEEIWEDIESFRRCGRHLHGPSDAGLRTFKIIS